MLSQESSSFRSERPANFRALFQVALMQYWVQSLHPKTPEEEASLLISWGSEEADGTGYAELFAAAYSEYGDRLTLQDLQNQQTLAAWMRALNERRHARAA